MDEFWLPIHDHSSWARSVRWSCGRPGYRPLFDHREMYLSTRRELLAYSYVAAGILPPSSRLVITDPG